MPRHVWSRLQVMDFGYPQFTEAKILTEYIKTDAYKMAVSAFCRQLGMVGHASSGTRCKLAAAVHFTAVHSPTRAGTLLMTPSHSQLIVLLLGLLQVQARPPMAVTNAVSWRTEGISYKKNEVFLDVVESVNLLVNSNGTVVRSEVAGALKMRTYLSGMPECKLGLNDKVGLVAVRAGKGL